jgi:phage-related protein
VALTLRDIGFRLGYELDEKSVNNVESSIKSLKEQATKMLGGIAVVVAVKKAAQFVSDCVSVASEVEEMQNKFDVVFGEINETVDEWAQNYADAIGRNKNDIKSYLADQQNLLVGFGMTREAGAELSEQMTSLALDLASFGNMDEATAVDAMTKAVMGQSESAKTLGAVLNDTTREQAMLTLGLSGTYDSLDQLTKMQVNYQAILSQSADAVGDCERSLDSYESTMKQFQAKLKEIKTLIGQFFMPTFQKVLSFGSRMLTRLRDMLQKLTNFIDKIGGSERVLRVLGIALAATFAIINITNIAKMAKKVVELATGFAKANTSAKVLFAIILILALLIEDFLAFMRGDDSLFGTMLEKAGVDCDQFRQNVIKIWNNIKTVLGAIWQGLKNVAIPIFQGIWEAIKTVFEAIGRIIEKIAPKFAELVEQLANGEVDTEKWVQVGETIGKIAAAIVGVVVAVKTAITVVKTVTSIVKGIGSAISFLTSPVGLVIVAIAAVIAIVVVCIKHWDQIKAAFIAAWDAIKAAWGAVVDFFKGIWDGIVNVFKSVVSFYANLYKKAWEAIKAAWSAVVGWFKGIWDGIVAVFSAVVSWYSGIFQSAWSAIVSIWNAVVGWFQGVWDGIVGVFSAVVSWFTGIFSQAWEGIKAVFSGVGDFFQGIWDTIVSLFTSIGTAVGDAISGAVKGAVNAVLKGAITIINGFISAINFAIGIINKIPGVSINTLSQLDVPQLAEGGYVEADNPRAVIVGDNKNEGEIVSPISKMRDTVISALQLFAQSATPTSSAKAMTTDSSSRSIVQNVNINNEFNGDRAGQSKSASAMDKASEDATSQMARALAFAR